MRPTSDDGLVREGEPDDSTAPRPQLGLFAKLPRPGEVKTRLAPPLSAPEAARLYGAFLEDLGTLPARFPAVDHTLYLVPHEDEAACRALLPRWRHRWQVGADLGERLDHAFVELHHRGGPAILLGSDHPDLPPAALASAFGALERSDVVLGPTPDGGYYLIGTSRPVAGLFEGVPWSSPETLRKTVERAEILGCTIAQVEPWSDVDSWEDVTTLAGRLAEDDAGAPATARVCRELLARHGAARKR